MKARQRKPAIRDNCAGKATGVRGCGAGEAAGEKGEGG